MLFIYRYECKLWRLLVPRNEEAFNCIIRNDKFRQISNFCVAYLVYYNDFRSKIDEDSIHYYSVFLWFI